MLYALITFVLLDYVIGVMCAVNEHTLSSEVGFRGICKRNRNGERIVIFFYLSNEGVSILENAGRLGLPIPKKLKDILAQLHDRAEGEDEEEEES